MSVGVAGCVWGDYHQYVQRWFDSLTEVDQVVLVTDRPRPDIPCQQIVDPPHQTYQEASWWTYGVNALTTDYVATLGVDDELLPGAFDGVSGDVFLLGMYVVGRVRMKIMPPYDTAADYLQHKAIIACHASPFRRELFEGYPQVAYSDWKIYMDFARTGAEFVNPKRAGIRHYEDTPDSLSKQYATESGKHRTEALQSTPKVFHTVWVQGPPLPAQHQAWFDSWLEHNPTWEHRLWAEEDYLPLLKGPVLEVYETAVNHAQRAEIAQKAILYEHGGVYHDADFECFRPVGEFFHHDRVVTWDESPGQLGNQLTGAPRRHPAVLEALEDIPRSIYWQRETGRSQQFGAGPHLIQRLWRNRPDVEIRPSHEFFPYLWNEPKPSDFGDAYGAHHWTASWKRGKHGSV